MLTVITHVLAIIIGIAVGMWFGINLFIAVVLWAHGGFSKKELLLTIFGGIYVYGSRLALGLRIWRVFDD